MHDSDLINDYACYLRQNRKAAENTLSSYIRDLKQFEEYLCSNDEGIGFVQTEESDIRNYAIWMRELGKSPASCARSLSSIRNFYSYLIQIGFVDTNPAKNVSAEKAEHKLPSILTNKEVELLLQQPRRVDAKGIRDAAMLELMYATGIRVSELIGLNVCDVNLSSGDIHCCSKNKERFIPIYTYALNILRDYLDYARPALVDPSGTDALFVNMNGKRMSRQGFWKIIKYYQNKAGIQKDITPHMLRHSFAAHLLENGADISAIQKILGHSDISSTRFYQKLVQNPIREVYQQSHPRA